MIPLQPEAPVRIAHAIRPAMSYPAWVRRERLKRQGWVLAAFLAGLLVGQLMGGGQ